MLFSNYIVPIEYLSFELDCEKKENKQKEDGIGPLKTFLVLFIDQLNGGLSLFCSSPDDHEADAACEERDGDERSNG